MAAKKWFGVNLGAPVVLLAAWFCLAPPPARAGTVSFDQTKTGSAGLSWTDPTTWAGGVIPAAGDDAFLTSSVGSGNTGVNFSTGSLTLNSLTVGQSGGGTMWLTLQGPGQLTVNTSIANQSGGQLINYGALSNFTAATIVNSAGATLSNGFSATVGPTLPGGWSLPLGAGFLGNETGGSLVNGGTLYNVSGSYLSNDGASILN